MFAPCLLVDAVDVYREDGFQLARLLQPGQGLVGGAGLGGEDVGQDALPVVPVKVEGVALEEGKAKNFIRGYLYRSRYPSSIAR